MTRRAARTARVVAALATVAVATSACGFSSLGELPLPLRAGTGPDAYQVTVEMEQVANLVPNAEVMVADVPVGSVVRTEVKDWKAVLTVSLDKAAVLPANAVARVAQKSLLGAEYLELAPPDGAAPEGRLTDGAVIGLDRSGRYPETEELLGALSVVLNGSGLQQVRTITTELNRVFDGRQDDLRSLVGNLEQFVGGLDAQRDDIVRALDAVNRLGGTLNADNATLARGIDTIPGALKVLNSDRENLVRTLEQVQRLDSAVGTLSDRSKEDLLANLRQIRPAVARLADAGTDLTQGIELLLTFPFPASTAFPGMFKGDYGNLFLTLDLTPEVLRRNLLDGFQLPGPDGPGVLAVPPLGAPPALTAPLAPFQDLTKPLDGVLPLPGADRPADPPDGSGSGSGSDGILGGLLGGGR
ncbi:MCE family protein [Pseudonocardia sp. ICBG1122]|nr:MCE family protein [Pseudonocardia pini]